MDNKVMGSVVGIPNPRSDWNQTDPMKADYIKNKPTKVSNFENDAGYATEEFVEEMHKKVEHYDHINGEEIDTKYRTGDPIPSILLYESAYMENGKLYENAPFDGDGIIVTHSCSADESLLTYQFALSWDGKLVHRCAADEDLQHVPWSDNFIPDVSAIQEMHDILEEAGVDANRLISACENAEEALAVAYRAYEKLDHLSQNPDVVSNALKGEATDTLITLDDVSPIEHTVKAYVDVLDAKVKVRGSNLFDVYSANRTSSNATCTVDALDSGHIKTSILKKGSPQYGTATINIPITKAGTLYFRAQAKCSNTELTKPELHIRLTKRDSGGNITRKIFTEITTEWNELTYSLKLSSFDLADYDCVMLLMYVKNSTADLANVGEYLELKNIMLSPLDSEYEPYREDEYKVKDGVAEIPSMYPAMIFVSDVPDATIKVDYNRDINKAFAELQAMILGG